MMENSLPTVRPPTFWHGRRFAAPFSERDSVLRIEGITVTISAVTILRGLSIAVETGATVGLVGRNGAGKTTTLRSIMGLTHLSSGRIDLDGNNLDGMSSYMRARLGIGYLPEDRRLRSEEHTSELQSLRHIVCRLLLEKKNNNKKI